MSLTPAEINALGRMRSDAVGVQSTLAALIAGLREGGGGGGAASPMSMSPERGGGGSASPLRMAIDEAAVASPMFFDSPLRGGQTEGGGAATPILPPSPAVGQLLSAKSPDDVDAAAAAPETSNERRERWRSLFPRREGARRADRAPMNFKISIKARLEAVDNMMHKYATEGILACERFDISGEEEDRQRAEQLLTKATEMESARTRLLDSAEAAEEGLSGEPEYNAQTSRRLSAESQSTINAELESHVDAALSVADQAVNRFIGVRDDVGEGEKEELYNAAIQAIAAADEAEYIRNRDTVGVVDLSQTFANVADWAPPDTTEEMRQHGALTGGGATGSRRRKKARRLSRRKSTRRKSTRRKSTRRKYTKRRKTSKKRRSSRKRR